MTEHGAQLVDDGGLDLTRGDAPDRTNSRPVLQHRLAHIVAIQPPALARVRRQKRPRRPGPNGSPLSAAGVSERVRAARLRGLTPIPAAA